MHDETLLRYLCPVAPDYRLSSTEATWNTEKYYSSELCFTNLDKNNRLFMNHDENTI